MHEDKYSAVIVTYNRIDLLKICIQSALQQSKPFDEIIIIDNASTDGTKEYLDSLNEDRLCVFHEETNGGGAAGFWRGVDLFQNSISDWALLIDDDAILNPDFLQKIDNVRKKSGNKYSAFSGTVTTGGKIDITHRKNFGDYRKFLLASVPYEDYEKSDTFECDSATFCGLIVSKELVRKIGLPRKDFFIWFDDTEYSLRIMKYSKILNVNTACIDHRTNNTTLKNQSRLTWKNYYGIRNEILISKEYFGQLQLIRLITRNTRMMISFFLQSFKANKNDNIYNYLLCKNAIWDAWRGKSGVNINYLP